MVLKKSRWLFVCLIPLFVAAFFFFAPTGYAEAGGSDSYIDVYKLSCSPMECSYGDVLFKNLTNTIDRNSICVYGNMSSDDSKNFVMKSNKSDGCAYVLIIQSLLGKLSGSSTLVQLINEEGRVVVSPGKYSIDLQNSEIYLASTKDTSFPLQRILYFTSSDNVYVTVNARVLKVSLDSQQVVPVDENGVIISLIERTFGQNPLSLGFIVDPSTPLAFGNEQLDVAASFDGNDRYSNVGNYNVAVSSSNVKVFIRQDDNSCVYTTSCYTISCDQNIRISVKPFEYIVPQKMDSKEYLENSYANYSYDYEEKYNPTELSGVDLYLDYKLLRDGEANLDEFDSYAVSSQSTGYHNYSVTINRIINSDTEININNVVLVLTELHCISIRPRVITIYQEGAITDPDDNWLPIPADGFSNEYGLAYAKKNSVSLASLSLSVTFSIKNFDTYLLSENAVVLDEDKLVLDIGEYSIEDAVVHDTRYSVSIHESLKYVIRSKSISFEQLVSTAAVIEPVLSENDSYIVDVVQYGNTPTDGKVKISFNDTFSFGEEGSVPQTKTKYIDFTFNCTSTSAPGDYASIEATSPNYAITDFDKVYVRINRIPLSVIMSGYEYNKTPAHATVVGAVSGLECKYSMMFGAGNAFRYELKELPVDAGNYNLKVTLDDDEKNYCFINNGQMSKNTSVLFTISPRPINAVINIKKQSRFFGETAAVSDIISADYFYASGNGSVKGLLGDDEFWDFSCPEASDVTVKPGSYEIKFIQKKQYKNYECKRITCNDVAYSGTANFVVNKIPESQVTSQLFTLDGKMSKTFDSITLPGIKVKGISLNSLKLACKAVGEDNVFVLADGLTVNELFEGTSYRIKYILGKDNDLIELTSELSLLYVFGTTSDSLELSSDTTAGTDIITDLEKPVISQLIAETTSSRVFVLIHNFREDNSYVGRLNNEDFTVVNSYINNSGDSPQQGILVISHYKELVPNTEYSFVLVRNTQYAQALSDTITVRTAASKPLIAKLDAAVTSDSISLVGPSDLTFACEYIKVLSGHSTIGSLSEDDNDELAPYFADERYSVTAIDGLSLSQLDPDSVYYVRVYVKGTQAENNINSDSIYFEFHTEKPVIDNTRALSGLYKASGYFSVSFLGLFFVLSLFLIIRFSFIKKKLRRS